MKRKLPIIALALIVFCGLIYAQSVHTVTVTWPAAGGSAVAYNVERATSPTGPFTVLNSAPIGALTFTDLNVSNGTTYFYRVRGVDASGTVAPVPSPNSNPAVVPADVPSPASCNAKVN